MSHELNDLCAEVAALRAERSRLQAAECALRQAEATFHGLLEQAPDGIVIVDTQGCITIINRQAEILFGYPRDELIGQPIECLVPGRLRSIHQRVRAAYTAAARTRPMGAGMDLLARRKDGSAFPAEISLSPLQTENGLLITAVVRDSTERVRAAELQRLRLAERMASAEAAMLQSARLATIGQMAASIAHEINNPLYAARNCLYLLNESFPQDCRNHAYLGIAQEQLDRIAAIIERMRDFYRPMRGDMAPFDLNAVIEETLQMARHSLEQAAIRVRFTPAQALPPVLGNADQLRQVFLNLILNAIDAMPEGGSLLVRTTATQTQVTALVQDTGAGMPEHSREQIFEPFFTNKPHGAGLGLPISAHSVLQHGGKIEVESEEGVGSTFRVILPIQPNKERAYESGGHAYSGGR